MIEHLDGGTDAPRLCVRKGGMKLILSNACPTTMFNLSADPLERNDLAGTGHEAEAELTAIASETWDLAQLSDDIKASQRARSLVDRALSQGRQTDWTHMGADLPADRGYVR